MQCRSDTDDAGRSLAVARSKSHPSSEKTCTTNASGDLEVPEMHNGCETLEKVCIETVESGHMTRDLSTLIGPDQPWLNTQAFLAKLDDNLQKAMK